MKWFPFFKHRDTKSDLYRAGQDYMYKLLDMYPERLAVDMAWKTPRDYDNWFDRGVMDALKEYQDRSKLIKFKSKEPS